MFASAVVLFTMVTQCMPFEKAVGEDKYYRLIATNKSEKYWKIFETADISTELKDLLIGMLQYDPSTRYTMEQILAHPWVHGSQLSHEKVVA